MQVAIGLNSFLFESFLPPLLQHNGPRIPDIESQHPLIVHKDSNERRPSQLRINLALQQLRVGGAECQVNDFY